MFEEFDTNLLEPLYPSGEQDDRPKEVPEACPMIQGASAPKEQDCQAEGSYDRIYQDNLFRRQIREKWPRWLDILVNWIDGVEDRDGAPSKETAYELLKLYCDEALDICLRHRIRLSIVPLVEAEIRRAVNEE